MKSRLEQLPRDIRILLALSLDLPDILAYCESSDIIRKNVCDDPEFWYKRLHTDYNIDRQTKYKAYVLEEVKSPFPDDPDIEPDYRPVEYEYGPKKYYEYITEFLQNPDPYNQYEKPENNLQFALELAAQSDDINKMKAALKKGADINQINRIGRHILYYPLAKGNLEMAKYIINLPNFSKKNIPSFIDDDDIFNKVNYIPNEDVKNYYIEQAIWKE